MNLNIYKRHKSFFLHTQQKQKPPSKAHSNAVAKYKANQLLTEAKSIYHSQSNLDEAVEAFHKFLEVYPDHDEALYLCAVCEVQIQRFEEAIFKFVKISQEYSLKQNALLLASIAENKLGHVARSFELVNQCLRKSPKYEEALCFRGKLNLQTSQFIKAEQDFKNVVMINPKSYLGFIGLADCCKFAYKYERAIELYERSLDLLVFSKETDGISTRQISLKMGVCYYLLEKYQESRLILCDLSQSKEMKTSELFYYLGLVQLQLSNRQVGLNHLEYAIRLETNQQIIEKAFKKLVLLYLGNYQFYEAQTLCKMSQVYAMKVELWKQMIDSFMLVVRSQFEEGLRGMTKIYELIQAQKHSRRDLKFVDKDKKIDDFIFRSEHISKLFKSKHSVLKTEKRIRRQKKSPTDKQRQLLPLKRSIDKIESLRLNMPNYHSFPLKLGRFKTEYQQPLSESMFPPFTDKQKQVIYPILLRFKAYCEFFTDKLMSCNETLEEYEVYIQDLLGKESDVKYSKSLCEILMFVESQQLDEALLKCNEAINLHYQKYDFDNILPLLYKIAVLIRMAIVSILDDQQQKEESYEILMLTLEMVEEKQVLKDHPLTHHFKAIIYILVEDYQNARESLVTALKLAEPATSSKLFMKGLVEMRLGNYLVAFKEISACLGVKKTDQAYLARAIILYYLSQQKDKLKEEVFNLVLKSLTSDSSAQQVLKQGDLTLVRECIVEKCLDDLQFYIDLCQNDDEIPNWVTKVLFACRSYDEVLAAIQNVTTQTPEMNAISNCLSMYNGDFEKGGKAGLIIKSALDGKFLTKQQEEQLLKQAQIKSYTEEEFDYLCGDYQKWLVVLHLYMKEQYELCIKYIQRMIVECKEPQEQLILRFNLAFIYFLTHHHQNGIEIVKSLSIHQQSFPIGTLIDRILNAEFQQDECLGDLTQFLHLRASKMLSNYLPYRPIYLNNSTNKIRIFGRISIPFPPFPKPNLQLQFDINFILGELELNKIPKSMEAPWIKRANQTIQFTDNMQDTIVQLDGRAEQGGLALPLKALTSKPTKEDAFSLT